MAWKSNAKQDGCSGQGPAMKQKQPAAGVMPGSGGVSSQMNPRRDRRQDYDGGNAEQRRSRGGRK